MDDLSEKISELLSDPQSMEKIRTLAGMFGAGGQSESEQQPPPEQQAQAHTQAQGNGMPFDDEMLQKMQRAFALMRKDDPRVSLLLALKPNLSEERRRKVDEAVHLLRLVNLLPLLQEGIL